jgi:dTDP-4-dehydrorhamnose 3,5-epimerase
MQQARTRLHGFRSLSTTHEAHALPDGVHLRPLTIHSDDRGWIGELFRNEWAVGAAPVQWVMSASEAGVMRGVHVHVRHDDYFVVVDGRAALGLYDLRPGSPTHGLSALLDLRGQQPAAVVIPHGVAHGLLFLVRSSFVLGSTHYYDRTDELGCHWRDPELRLNWPRRVARLSPRDQALPPLREVAPHILPWK